MRWKQTERGRGERGVVLIATLCVMRVTVLLFGAERDAAGTGRALVELADDCRCAVLRRALCVALPVLQGALERGRFAVNGAFVDDAHVLVDGDEVALIGLVGGG